MKYYLSSYKFGNHLENLKKLRPENPKFGHINNAKDWVGRDPEIAAEHQQEEIEILASLGFEAEPLDLKNYFGKQDELAVKLRSLGGVWVSGGNTFVLRQAMKLSGFDILFPELIQRTDFLYSGYSAGICILSKTLKTIENVDDPFNFPYKEIQQPIYDGLGVFEYSFMPHYDSDHFESEACGQEIQRCIDNKWLFVALRDGDVIIME